jgi:glycerol kinase
MQFQADILGIPVERPALLEATAMGAAAMAGFGIGFVHDRSEIDRQLGKPRYFDPCMRPDEREARYATWQRAVERSRAWAEVES